MNVGDVPDVTAGLCAACGAVLADGQCPVCVGRPAATLVRREIVVLTVLVACAATMFLLTRSLAGVSERLRREDAAEWHQTGLRALESGNPAGTLRALRRASAKDPDNREYSLALATALITNRQPDAARQVLLGLRSLAPESPDVNARLARLEAATGNRATAVRYYQNALYGFWGADHIEALRRLRVEFIRFLLTHGELRAALAELLVLEGNLPEDAEFQVEVGRLFLEAGDDRRAAEQFTRALRLAPRDGDALAGAGVALFGLGDYARAQRYLRSAPDDRGRVIELRVLVDFILARDPLLPRLRLTTRIDRLESNLTHVVDRVDRCLAAQSIPQTSQVDLSALRKEAQDLLAALRRRRGEVSMDVVEEGVDLTNRIEQQIHEHCGPPEPLDRALVIMGRRHQVDAS